MKLLSFTLGLFFLFQNANAIEVGGINMSEKLSVEGTELVLNGAGIREKYWIKLYVGGLFLKQKSSDPKQIIDADEIMAIRLHITSGMVTSDKLKESLGEGLKKSTKGNTAAIANEIQTFEQAFISEPIKENDIFDFVYVPGKGVVSSKISLSSGAKKTFPTVAGLPFKKALFGIWLCDDPAEQKLKDKMLGK